MNEETYSSPRHKLVSSFHRSRDHWRQRAKTYQEQIRALKVRVRDVEASRDHWREKYFQSQARASGSSNQAQESGERPQSSPEGLPASRRRVVQQF